MDLPASSSRVCRPSKNMKSMAILRRPGSPSIEAGSGPYALDEWIVGQKITLKRFDDYWKGWSGEHPNAFEPACGG